MILRDVQVPGKELKCEQCSFVWISIAKDLPEFCPNRECRSRQWNGAKKQLRPTRIELPKPTQIKENEGDDTYEF
jgi:hypothetical protein